MTELCGTCRFWEFISRPDHDFSEGQCRRHAPQPRQLQTQYILEMLNKIAWAVEAGANIEHSSDDDYNQSEGGDQFKIYEWPVTSAADWCGDYHHNDALVIVNDRHPNHAARIAAVPQWEDALGLDNSGPWIGQKWEDFPK